MPPGRKPGALAWLSLAYFVTCSFAALFIVLMSALQPAQAKLLPVWLVFLTLPLSDWAFEVFGPGPFALWGGIALGFIANSALLLSAGWLLDSVVRICLTKR